MIIHQKKNPLAKILKIFLIFGSIFILSMIVIILFPQFLTKSSQFIFVHVWQLRLIRWSLILSFIFAWNPILNFLNLKRFISFDAYEFWKTKRIYIAFWLIIFEVLICENILFKLIEVI